MPSNSTASYINPLELMWIASPLINDLTNQGKARPTSRSNTFEPNVFETPMSTRPVRWCTILFSLSLWQSPDTLTNDENTAQCIRNTATRGKKGDAHHAVGYAESETNHCDHPDHQIGEETQPNDGHRESDGIPLRPAEGEREIEHIDVDQRLTVGCDSQEWWNERESWLAREEPI